VDVQIEREGSGLKLRSQVVGSGETYEDGDKNADGHPGVEEAIRGKECPGSDARNRDG
jgi:hypothetical protein